MILLKILKLMHFHNFQVILEKLKAFTEEGKQDHLLVNIETSQLRTLNLVNS